MTGCDESSGVLEVERGPGGVIGLVDGGVERHSSYLETTTLNSLKVVQGKDDAAYAPNYEGQEQTLRFDVGRPCRLGRAGPSHNRRPLFGYDTQYLAALHHGGLCCPQQADTPIPYDSPDSAIALGKALAIDMKA